MAVHEWTAASWEHNWTRSGLSHENLKDSFSTHLLHIIIMWQFSVLCYHSPIEMHNNLFPLGACLHGELSGGDIAHIQCYQLGKPWPVVPGSVHVVILRLSSSLLGLTAVQKEWIQLWSDTLRRVARPCCFKRDQSNCILCLYLPLSAYLTLSLSQVSDS